MQLTFDSNIVLQQNVVCDEVCFQDTNTKLKQSNAKELPRASANPSLQAALHSSQQKFILSEIDLLALLSSDPLGEGKTEMPRLISDLQCQFGADLAPAF